MSNISWKEFKQHVEIIMHNKGISQDEPLAYVDVSFPEIEKMGVESTRINVPQVEFDDDTGLSIFQ